MSTVVFWDVELPRYDGHHSLGPTREVMRECG